MRKILVLVILLGITLLGQAYLRQDHELRVVGWRE